MKNLFKSIRETSPKVLLTLLGIMLTAAHCVFLDSVSITQTQQDGTQTAIAKAGTEATFTIKGHIEGKEESKDDQFVVSILVPKSWNVKANARVTYKTTLHTNPDEELKMSVIRLSSLPKNGGGRTWAEALIQEYGVGPNVLSDMEWVTFATDAKWTVFNGDKADYTIFIHTNVGQKNLKAYLGFFVNHTNDGISPGDVEHKKIAFSQTPFEVVGAENLLIDFSTEHFNKVQPLAILQDDYVTISFNGGVFQNDLVNSDEIYFEGTAYDEDGVVIAEINEKSSKTLLKRKNQYELISSLTIWPANFFNVPEGQTISRVNYVFTNRSRTVVITQSDDDFALKGTAIPSEKEPFAFELLCD